jgi:hypothetical protein
MTGRAAGICAGYDAPGYASQAFGFRGAGGHGWRHWYYATGRPGWARAGWGAYPQYTAGGPFEARELDALKAQAKSLGDTLEQINSRIAELEKDSGSEAG